MKEKITKTQVQAFAAYLEKKYSCEFTSDRSDIWAVEWAVSAIGVDLKKFTLTLGETSFLNFDLGKGTLDDRILQACCLAHECQHVLQYQRDPIQFVTQYALSKPARTHYEVDGYRVTMEMYYFFTGRNLAPKDVAAKLYGYKVSASDVHVARKHFEVTAAALKLGIVTSGVGRDAIKWWRKQGVHGNLKK